MRKTATDADLFRYLTTTRYGQDLVDGWVGGYVSADTIADIAQDQKIPLPIYRATLRAAVEYGVR